LYDDFDARGIEMLDFYLSLIEAREDRTKFERLYTRYVKLMTFTAEEILQDRFLAEDAAHEAFIKIIRYLEKIEDISSFKTRAFVVTITRNAAIDIYKKRSREKQVSFDELGYEIAGGAVPEDEVLRKLGAKELAGIILRLAEQDQDVLTLKFRYELKDKEIAAMLSVTNAAARKRLERAKTRLRSKAVEYVV
jgi:RNA polymerase sigma-70 factor (ECF subfamily)